MAERRSVQNVTYREAGEGYFEQRSLRRHAGVWSLWALGVAAVISGDFSGWNFGLAEGGFGGLLIATVVITIMYFGLCFSIAEMSPALPHTGGAYSFGRSAMGPWGGFITGVAENIEYVVTPAVIVFFAGTYTQTIIKALAGVTVPQPVLWALLYAIFVGLNVFGVEATFRFSVVICLMALAILLVFYITAIPKVDFSANALNIAADDGGSKWLPFGVGGIFASIPFAIWFFLAIEELPLAAEESHDPKRDIPKGTIYGLITLIVTAFLTLFFSAAIAPGAEGIGASDEPLLDSFRTIFGSGTAASLLGLVAVTGLIASFHTIIFAYGRNIYSLSRAGYFPHWLSVTHGRRQTPHVALIGGAVVGYVLTYVMYEAGTKGGAGAALLNMAVFGAVISYVMQMIAFVLLRRKLPNIERPYRSPVGEWGAIVAGIIATVSLVTLFANKVYRPGVLGAAVWFLLAIVYFAIAGRHKLVLSPEEEFAMTLGEHGRDPASEGYGKTHLGEVGRDASTAPTARDAGPA